MAATATTKYLALAGFIAVTLGGGLLIGYATLPGAWYAGLTKPPFNPPNWIFGPVWSALYIMIAIAGWRTWLHARHSTAMNAWFAQLGLNFLWSPVFFGWQRPDAALAVIVALLAAILLFFAQAVVRDRISALLFTPYLLWVAFATVLNVSIWWLN